MKKTLESLNQRLNNIISSYKKANQNKKTVWNSYQEIEQEINFDETTSIIPTKLGYSLSFWFSWLIIIALGYFAFVTAKWLLLIATAIIISVALENMILFFTRKLKSRWWAIFLSYFIFLAVLVSGIIVIVPFVATQIWDLINTTVNQINVFEKEVRDIGLTQMIQQTNIYRYLDWFGLEVVNEDAVNQLQKALLDNLSQIISFSSSYVQNAGNVVVNIVSWFFSALAQIWFVIVLAILISVEKRGFLNFIVSVSPKKHIVWSKIVKIYDKLSFWLRSQMILGLIIGMVIYIALWIFDIFGIDIWSKLSLAVIAWLTELIPYIWPFLGGVPIVLMGVVSYGRLWFALMLGLVILVQQLENNVLIPILFKKTLGINPIVMFLCAILLGTIAGLNGIILAAPVAIIISIIFEKEDIKKEEKKQTHRKEDWW